MSQFFGGKKALNYEVQLSINFNNVLSKIPTFWNVLFFYLWVVCDKLWLSCTVNQIGFYDITLMSGDYRTSAQVKLPEKSEGPLVPSELSCSW